MEEPIQKPKNPKPSGTGKPGLQIFFWAPVSINIEKRCNHYRLIVACMLSGVRSIHPEIVGWSTAPRGQVINENLGQVLKKLVSRPARPGKDRIITDPIGYETGWTIARSLGGVGTTSVHSNPVFACNDCTFLDELHRATLEKKIIVGKEETLPSSTLGRFQDL
jgi:hypothetical protein